MSDRMKLAGEHWGDVPGWVTLLVRACDETSQNQVAKRLNRSASVVSQAIKGSYRGDMDAFARRVQDVLQAKEVECPSLGEISSGDCQDWRDKAERMTSANPMMVTMFRACRKCPRFTPKENFE